VEVLNYVLGMPRAIKIDTPNLSHLSKNSSNNAGLAYQYWQYDKALEYTFDHSCCVRRRTTKKGWPKGLNNIGLIFYNLEDYVTAISKAI